jgi:1-aminocyclopropane-1-carboxylate deaminase
MHSSKKGNRPIKANNIDWTLVPQTRLGGWWHSYGPHGHQVYLKREDEVRFGMTGGKLRKYASILPWLQQRRIQTVALIGSANSNQMLSASMLLRENGIRPVPFLKKGHAEGTNQFLLSLLVSKAEWHLIASKDWSNVENLAAEFVAECRAAGNRAVFLPEGACVKEALAGAMTLAADIRRNEEEAGEFRDIFIDAGTGLSAAALLLGMFDLDMPAKLHVTLMADKEAVFLQKFQVYAAWYEELHERKLPDLTERMVLHRPIFGRSYGSVNAEVIAAIKRFASMGIFTDPIYSAKHLATAESILDQMKGRTNALVIHSGGAQALPGYAHLFGE